MTTSSSEDIRVGVCPYLHQLQMDWLSMDSDGFYCHGSGGHTKVLNAGMCTLENFASCIEYRRLSGQPGEPEAPRS